MRKDESYRETFEWIRNKKSIINPKNINDDNCFQYSITVALDHKSTGRDPQRILKIKTFIIKYNWEGIEFPAIQKEWKKFEQNNETTALNILYVLYNTEQIGCAYKLKYNNERKN